MYIPRAQKGFTLIEMAVVLTVIALIVGGIVVGQSLIRQSQIQGAIKDIDMYGKAIQEFRDKYNALPGDMTNAEDVWGTDDRAGGCPNTTYSATPYTKTCNGNGDGMIAYSTVATGWSYSYEVGRAWQQLANAGLISGSYNGISGTGGAVGPSGWAIFVALPGINVPASKLPGGGYTLWYLDNPTGSTGDWPGVIGHVILLGAQDTARYTDLPVLTPEEAYEVDMKLDDGMPSTGNIKSERNSVNPNCNTSDVPGSAQYKVSYKGLGCAIMFYLGF